MTTRVLWIDEDSAFAQMTAQYFQSWDIALTTASNPPAAPEWQPYDAVVWDFTFHTREQRELLRRFLAVPGRETRPPVYLLFSRPVSLEEHLFLNEFQIRYGPKWSTLWDLLQRLQDVMT